MPERPISTINELPHGDEARNRVAHQIKKARKIDRASAAVALLSEEELFQRQLRSILFSGKSEETWQNDRLGSEYISSLGGVEATLQYIKSLDSKLVIDVGTGTSQGISDIAKSKLGEGLEFKGTTVTWLNELNQHLGKDRVLITSAESLRGIENNSVGGILALYSISYTAQPQQVVARFDQVLVEGGVVKMVTHADQKSRSGHRTFESFLNAFKELGYDINESERILLAVKPSSDKSKPSIKAGDLMQLDKASLAEKE